MRVIPAQNNCCFFFILLISLSVVSHIYAADTTTVVQRPASSTTVNVNNPTPTTLGPDAKNCKCIERKPDAFERTLILLPMLGFILLFGLFYYRLKKGGFKLSDALSENDITETKSVTTLAPASPAAPGTTTTQDAEQTDPGNRSTSRLILFLSGMTAIIIAISLVTYYLYYYFFCGSAPDFDSLISVILTLGIGVIPYAVNKITK